MPTETAATALNPGYVSAAVLKISMGQAADFYPAAAEWSRAAGIFILEIGARDHGLTFSAKLWRTCAAGGQKSSRRRLAPKLHLEHCQRPWDANPQ